MLQPCLDDGLQLCGASFLAQHFHDPADIVNGEHANFAAIEYFEGILELLNKQQV